MNRVVNPVVDAIRRIIAAAFACAFAILAIAYLVSAYTELFHGWSWLVSVRRANTPLADRLTSAGLVLALALGCYMAAGYFARAAWRQRRDSSRDDPFAPPTCRACGYDLRATPRRCPECGGDTGFAELDEAAEAGTPHPPPSPLTPGPPSVNPPTARSAPPPPDPPDPRT